jgi:subtilisin family serine protease
LRSFQITVAAILALGSVAEFALAGDIFKVEAEASDSLAPRTMSKLPAHTKAPRKLILGLDSLSAEFQAYELAVQRGVAAPGIFETRTTMARIVDGGVAIDAVPTDDPEALESALESLGAEVNAIAGRMVSARISLSLLPALESLESLRFARPALYFTRAGSVSSRGDVAQYSNLARARFGVSGAGEMVGVLSDSFDCSGMGSYADDRASGDLPANVDILDDRACPGTDEGRAMAQIVHDLAPGAGLAFHTASRGEANFAEGIRDLAAAGATIIVDDIGYFAEPMFQDGVIAQAVDEVSAQGVSYFSSAGNAARQSYEAPFRPSGAFIDLGYGPLQLHDFDAGPAVDAWQRVSFNGKNIPFSFQWDQPFFSVSGAPGSRSDIDVCVSTEPSPAGLLGCAAVANVGSDPLEIWTLSGSGTVYFAIAHVTGPYPTLMKYIWFSDAISDLEHGTHSPTIFGHPNAAGANAVGAADYRDTPAFGTNPPDLQAFSSAGGIPILFDTAGNSTYVLRQKPEFTAPDNGNTTFFIAGYDPEPDGFPNFPGTSAAAPHAAGVAALMREVDPSLMPLAIRVALQHSATDILARKGGASTGVGYDADSGAGLLDAEIAVGGLAEPSGPLADIEGDEQVSLLIDGLIIARKLLGYTGDNLTSGLSINPDTCTRCDASAIEPYLEQLLDDEVLNVDGGGETQLLSDGLMLLRKMLGYTGSNLTSGLAIPASCARCDASAIEAYLEKLL